MFDLCEDLLDRVEVGTVGRQKEQSASLTRMALWASSPVWLPSRDCRMTTSLFLRVGANTLLIWRVKSSSSMIHGALMHGLPVTKRRGCFETLPTRPPAAQRRHTVIQVSSIKTKREASILP